MEEHQPQPTVAQPKVVQVGPGVAQAQAIQVVNEEPVHTLEHVDLYLRIGQESDASDIHLAVNVQPTWRRFGNLEPIWLQADPLTHADTERLAVSFLNEEQKHKLFEKGDVDFAYATPFGRFRASVVRHRLGI